MTSVPRLGVLYEPDSVQAMHMAEAARGDWETVWLIDRDVADPGSMLRLLSRLGEVVDITGLDAPAVPGATRGGGLDGVVAFDDKFLCRAAAIADEHGLATYGSKVAERLTDKELQRAAFRAAGLPTPGSARLLGHDGAGGDDAVRGLRGQLVVKPATGSNGSRDVFLVEGPAEVLEMIAARRAAGLTADMVA